MSSAPIIAGQPSENNHNSRSPRLRIDSLMYVDLGPDNGGFPINVSEGGMAFQGIRPLGKDQLIRINFKLPGLSNAVESAAQIAWVNDLGKGGGLRFIDLPDCTRQLINEWLSMQTSFCGLTENRAIPCNRIETKKFPSDPVIHSETNQPHSTAKSDPSAVKESLESPLSPVAAANAIAASDNLPIAIPPVNSARDSGFQGPRLKTKRRNAWSMPVLLGLITFLVIAATLSAIAFQFHWSMQLPTLNGILAQPVNKSEGATSPQIATEVQTANPPPLDPTDSGSALPAAESAIDPVAPSEEPTTPELKAPVSRPAKIAMPKKIVVPKKITSPKTLSQKVGMSAKHVTPSQKVISPAADLTPPTLALPTSPALASQLPALLSEMPSRAVAPREPVQRSSKFDAAQLLERKNPVYPKLAQAVGLSGSVELHFIIGADGNVHDVTVVKGNPLLARAAVEAIQTSHYQPARRDGVPVETESNTVFAFKPN
jgi:TonB family protein